MNIFIFFIILLVLVLIHEAGHFFAAKWAKMRVDEFAFGFPPKIYSIKKGETEYSFNALPIGGFVRIFGENALGSKNPPARSFTAAPRWKQLIVLVAGVTMNALLAFILITATYLIGTSVSEGIVPVEKIKDPKTVVVYVQDGTPAARAGITAGDQITAITVPNSSLDGTFSSKDVSMFVSAHQDETLGIFLKRPTGETYSVSVTPEAGYIEGRKAIGLQSTLSGTAEFGIVDSIRYGAETTWVFLRETLGGFGALFSSLVNGSAKEAMSSLSGPVGIVGVVGDAYDTGLTSLLLVTAIISINLAVLNILPLPALDGGRIVFVLIEMIIRRPIPQNIQLVLNGISFALLLLLMLYVTFQDIIRLI